jgi:phenylalanyl-tRNA synthetase beta chain
MRVSLNSIKQYTDVDGSVDELVAKINQQLGGVENTINFGDIYKDAVIVKVIKCEKHPNADKLNVCKVDDGGNVKDVPRDTDGLVEVVCGAPNVKSGMMAVWLPPMSIVPASYHDEEPFVLGARELRGIVSNGMLASQKELAIGDGHDGILEIDPNEWKPSDKDIKPGVSFAQTYGLNDTIIEIENKMFTHRPDLFGQLGVAREIAGIQHKTFTSPAWYVNVPEFNHADGLQLEVTNGAAEKVPRFMAVTIKNVKVKPSPLWLQIELVRLGGKPINNIVDVTNYIMLLTAQPTHAYDYDKLRGNKLGTRMAMKGEKAELLNGKTYELTEDDVVIVDGEGIVGLGGIMGGGNSEVSIETKNIVLEVANFDMYGVRKTSMRHGIFTDALTRFNKGQSPLQNPHVLNLLMMSIHDVAGGEQASSVYDEKNSMHEVVPVTVTPQFINDRLGLQLNTDEISSLLTNVEFKVQNGTEFIPPFWRTDIELPEDIVEEVGRLYGFDKLPRVLPQRSIAPAPLNAQLQKKQLVRNELAKAGANEVLTYSFVHERTIKKAGQDKTHAFTVSNALSPDLQYYRLSLTPSLLEKVHMNQKAGFDKFALFELNKVHYKGEMSETEPDVPNEDDHVACVISYAPKSAPTGSAYFIAKRYVEQIMDTDLYELVKLSAFDLSTDEWGAQFVAPYEPSRSAVIVKDKQIWGVVGEFKPDVQSAFKLPVCSAGFEIHLDIVKDEQKQYEPLSRYPSISQDISLKVPSETPFRDVYDAAMAAAGKAAGTDKVDGETLSIYQPDGDGTEKTITLRLTVTSFERTLTEAEMSSVISAVAKTRG